ncbi:T9SS type A sorting domain-containing protein [bacterium]|nr:T9SS type A sorting domain-containing protein [bacterium]
MAIDHWNGNPVQVQGFVDYTGITYPTLLMGSEVADDYRVDRQIVILDKEGVARFVGVQHSRNFPMMQDTIRTYLSMGENGVNETQSMSIPKGFTISSIYPNPFNASLNIQLELSTSDQIKVQAFNMSGQLVDHLYSGTLAKGHHKLQWNPSNASGTYMILVQNNKGEQQFKRVIQLK